MRATGVFQTSEAEVTKRYYAELSRRGELGLVALNLFRAQKCSARAKLYRGGIRGIGSYRSMAYQRKSWSMKNLGAILELHGEQLGIVWGWKRDPKTPIGGEASWVLYVDLPHNGQVSFHAPAKGAGPIYAGEWDGQKKSLERILAFCDRVFEEQPDKMPGLFHEFMKT